MISLLDNGRRRVMFDVQYRSKQLLKTNRKLHPGEITKEWISSSSYLDSIPVEFIDGTLAGTGEEGDFTG